MAKHRKRIKRKLRRRVTMICEPLAFKGSYDDFARSIEVFTRKTHGKMIRNPDGSITSISPFGEVVTAVYGDLPDEEK